MEADTIRLLDLLFVYKDVNGAPGPGGVRSFGMLTTTPEEIRCCNDYWNPRGHLPRPTTGLGRFGIERLASAARQICPCGRWSFRGAGADRATGVGHVLLGPWGGVDECWDLLGW